MIQEERIIYFDPYLNIEAYHFKGVMQKFPNHFHDHYVIGFIESGQRLLVYQNKPYHIKKGDLLLFNPLELHTCEQISDQPLDYRCINIKTQTMTAIASEIIGRNYQPTFTTNVIWSCEYIAALKDLHQMITSDHDNFEKEECFILLMEYLIHHHTQSSNSPDGETVNKSILEICNYMEKNFHQTITLDGLSELSGLKKHTLLRAFTREKGTTPYCYLESLRINEAKTKLERGIDPLTVALETGFSDQSHFTKFFKRFIGLTPGQYYNIFARNKQIPKGEHHE